MENKQENNKTNSIKETDTQELSMENMEEVSAGFLGFLLPVVKKIGLEIVKLFK